MLSKFPVGEERRAIGQVAVGEPARIRVSYDSVDSVKSLRVKFWGSDNRCISRDIDVADVISVELINDAVEIDARLYTLHAVFGDDREKIISKGRVWLNRSRENG